ncbi:MAG: 8-amino-7-oxononanoate synthase [Aquisalimonadaceae bacterium]
MWNLRAELDDLKARGLERRPRALSDVHGASARSNGRDLLVFCSNDYLGLADHPEITAAFIEEARVSGVGSGASHLVTGHRPVHDALAEALADWLGRDRALLFSTGYMANQGVINTLLGRKDMVHQDRLNHASLLDGGLLCSGTLRRYAHADAADLEAGLALSARRHLVVTDGVFSMDGDTAPLQDICGLSRRYGAAVMVDDAHGLGAMGREGRGCLDLAGLGQTDVPLLVGTLGKAFGTFGAFVAGAEDWIELLQQRARTHIYTTAPPPAVAAATLASLRLVREEGWRRDRLSSLIERFRHGARSLGLRLMPSASPIQPLLIGEAADATAASQALEERGILVTAIRPPTVPAGSARLRITLSAAHEQGHVDRLLDALQALKPLLTKAA